MIDCDITVDGKKIIQDDFQLNKIFSNHYVNTDEINSGVEPLKTTNQSKDNFSVIDEIIRIYKDHPSEKQVSCAITESKTPQLIYFNLEPTNPV